MHPEILSAAPIQGRWSSTAGRREKLLQRMRQTWYASRMMGGRVKGRRLAPTYFAWAYMGGIELVAPSMANSFSQYPCYRHD